MGEWLQIESFRPKRIVGYVQLDDPRIYGPNKEPLGKVEGDIIYKGSKEVAKLGTFHGITVAANFEDKIIGMHSKGKLSNEQMVIVATFDAMQLFNLKLFKDPRLDRIGCAALVVLVLEQP